MYQIYNHSPSARVCIPDTTRQLMLYILLIYIYGAKIFARYKDEVMTRELVDAIFSFNSPGISVPFTKNVVHNIVEN